MRGKWAAGIPPRNFTWVIQDQLAMSERPGGFAPHHRRVRRQEEIIWLRVQGFTRIVSMLPSPHNLDAYEKGDIASAHFPIPPSGDAREQAVGAVLAARGVARQRRADSRPPRGARRRRGGGHGGFPALVGSPSCRTPGDRRGGAPVRQAARPDRARAHLPGRRSEADATFAGQRLSTSQA